MEIFCFYLGILYVYTHTLYAPVITALFVFLTPRAILIVFFILGGFIAYVHESISTPYGLPDKEVIQSASIQGSISSIPVQNNTKTQFIFDLSQYNGKKASGLVLLNWYNKAPTLHPGQKWQLEVKLKKPRNFQNPGSFDYVHSLKSRHIMWTGYVRSSLNTLLDTHLRYPILSLREYSTKNIVHNAPNKHIAGVIEALSLNSTPDISQEDWNLFRRTGTTHLFGISGEHIALIFSFFFFLSRWMWSKNNRLCLWVPAPSIAALVGFFMAFLYTCFAGFAPPAERALIGCFFYTIKCLGIRRFNNWQVWRYALFAVLVFEPHAVFMQGFYFSFLAVACLLFTQQRWGQKGYKAMLALQLSCLIVLMPLSLYWYSYGSFNGFIANLFAIPLVGFCIIPLSLLYIVFSSFHWSWLLMKLVSVCISVLFYILSWTEHLSWINIQIALTSIMWVIALIGAMTILSLLPNRAFRYLAIIWLVIAFFPIQTSIKPGEALIDVMDVGQGLAVSIRTQNHVLLYDTGDQFFQGSDMGKMVLLPFYTHEHIKKINSIIISHPDKDHRGGLESVEKELPVEQLLVNDPKFYKRGLSCHQYPQWEWDGVLFRFFPIRKQFKGKNNNSCILQIDNSHSRVLIPGDIEKEAEEYLVRKYSNKLQSDYLIIPHHGSKTSSSYRFLLEVAPKYAVASLGFDNRFHFPHHKTLMQYSYLNIPFYRTDECGMVEIVLDTKGGLGSPKCYKSKPGI